ncbi:MULTISPECIES: hypothetical protein [unclassified Saccharicrinis]|uniref:hypothetical protein n=1 Tax=unclassified Saccharicrinis TaxID=2646859 RepID=UPI003D332069
MKTIKFLTLAVLIFCTGFGNVRAEKVDKEGTIKKMVKHVQKDISRSFLDEDISLFVENGNRTKVYVTLRVCNDCCIVVLDVEGATEEIRKLIKDTINNNKVKTDEICKYRSFRVPLTFVYRE